MSTLRLVPASGFALLTVLMCADAVAQLNPSGALSSYVTTGNGATQSQVNAALAVQTMCNYLKSAKGGGYGLPSPTSDAPPPAQSFTTPAGDLFLRCNELVQTASALLGGKTSRSLGLLRAGLFGAVQQVSGVQLASQGTLATQVPAGQFANIGSRIDALRYGAEDAALRGRVSAFNSVTNGDTVADASVFDSYHYGSSWDEPGADTAGSVQGSFMHTAYISMADDQPAATNSRPSSPSARLSAVANPWGLFSEGSYDFGDRRQTSEEDAFNYYAKSITVGLDYNFGPAVAGATVGYDSYNANFQANGVSDAGGSSSVEGTTGSVFGAWFGPHWFFDGIASYGSIHTDVVRLVNYSQVPGTPPCSVQCGVDVALEGTPRGKNTAVGATAGYDMYVPGGWDLSPSLSVNYRHVSIDSYAERDLNLAMTPVGSGLPLKYGSQSIDSLRSVLSLAASRPTSFGFGVLSPTARLDWDHEYQNEARNIEAQYVADNSLATVHQCASCFLIPTERPARDFGTAGVGLSALFVNRLQASLYYERLIGVSYLTSNAITLGVRGQF